MRSSHGYDFLKGTGSQDEYFLRPFNFVTAASKTILNYSTNVSYNDIVS